MRHEPVSFVLKRFIYLLQCLDVKLKLLEVNMCLKISQVHRRWKCEPQSISVLHIRVAQNMTSEV